MREMKNSGVEWIGEIPAEWNVVRIGTQYTERKTKVSDTEYPPLSVTMKGILPQLATAAKSDAHDDRKLVRKGDFAINSRSDRRGSCGISPSDGSVSLINTILCPRDEMNPQYYDWLFHSTMFSDEFYKWGHGIVDDLWTTNWQDMKRIYIPEPPLDEQKKIADFLDHKCSEMDVVIEKTKDTIEEYKTLKQSIITNAVTKGVRGNRPMKDSCIKWIGEFPAEWTFAELKMFCNVNNGKEVINEIDKSEENSIPVYGSGGVFKYTDTHMYDGTTVMFGRKGTLGKPLYVTGKIWVVDTMYYLMHSTSLLPRFNYYQLCAFDWNPYITQTALPSIVASQIVAQKLVFPNVDEQQEIINYLDNKCDEIDTLIARKTTLIEKMVNYKKSVIYEYVTGKKEVI